MAAIPKPYANLEREHNYNEDLEYEKDVTPYVTKILEQIFDVVQFNDDKSKQLAGYGDYTCDGKRLESKTHQYDMYQMAKDFEARRGYRSIALEIWRDVDKQFRGSNITTFTGNYWFDAFVNQDRTGIIEYFLLDAQLLKSFVLNNENKRSYYRSLSRNRYTDGTFYNSQVIHIPLKDIDMFIYDHGIL